MAVPLRSPLLDIDKVYKFLKQASYSALQGHGCNGRWTGCACLFLQFTSDAYDEVSPHQQQNNCIGQHEAGKVPAVSVNLYEEVFRSFKTPENASSLELLRKYRLSPTIAIEAPWRVYRKQHGHR